MAENPNRTSRRTRVTASIVACAFFMQNLDSTVIATALPTMAKAFGSDPIHMNIALTAYMLSLAVFIPASGWVADRFGVRTIFRAAIFVFVVGSVLCGLSESLPALVGPVLGPPIGGFIVTYFSWRWIFYINIPIGLLGIVLVSLFIENLKEPPRGALDWKGQILCGAGLAGLMFGLQTVGRGVIPVEATVALIGIGLLGTAAFIVHARRHPAPLVDFSLLRERTFSAALYAMFLFRAGIGALPFLLPLMLQIGFGQTAVQSGLVTFASSAGALVMKPVAQRALRWFGFRETLFWNALFSGAMMAVCAAFRPTWPAAVIFAVLLIGGFFRSLQFTAYNTLAYADIPRARVSAATSLYSTVQQVALTTGVAVGAASLELAMLVSQHAVPRPADFSVAFLVIACLCAAAGPIVLRLPRNAGAELTGHGGPAAPARGGD